MPNLNNSVVFLKEAPDLEYLGSQGRWLICNDLIHMYYYPVMFGIRLRVGWIEDTYGCYLDWCLGRASLKVRDTMKDTLAKILEFQYRKGIDPFQNIPRFSDTKPLWNDSLFLQKIIELKSLCPTD